MEHENPVVWRVTMLAIVVVWMVVVAWPASGLGFLLDDLVAVDGLGDSGSCWIGGFLWPGQGEIYRPLAMLWFWLEYTVSGGWPAGLHGLHIVVFLLAALAASALARAAARQADSELVVAVFVLAVVWPGRLELVAWLAAVFDLLLAVLVPGALVFWLRPRPGRLAELGLVLTSVAAPLVKETGFVLTPLILLSMGRRPGKLVWSRALRLVVGPQILVFMLRWLALGGGVGGYTGVDAGGLGTGLRALPEALLRAVLMPVHPNRSAVVVLAVLAAVLGLAAVVGTVTGPRLGSKWWSLVFGIGCLPLVPVAGYLDPLQVVVDSRYLGLFGVALALALAPLARRPTWRWLLPALASSWLAIGVVNLEPWQEAAALRESVVEVVADAVPPGGSAMVRVEGPLGRVDGAQAVGGHLERLLRWRLPDRDLRAESLEHREARGLDALPSGGRPELRLTIVDLGQGPRAQIVE